MLQGVGLILLNPCGRIIVIKELVAKPEIKKEAGMHSMPLETVRPGEAPREAVERLIKEELGPRIVVEEFESFGVLRIANTRIFGYWGLNNQPYHDFEPVSQDVEIHGWYEPDEIRQMFIRRETVPLLDGWLEHQRAHPRIASSG